jgi:hypothetical protein
VLSQHFGTISRTAPDARANGKPPGEGRGKSPLCLLNCFPALTWALLADNRGEARGGLGGNGSPDRWDICQNPFSHPCRKRLRHRTRIVFDSSARKEMVLAESAVHEEMTAESGKTITADSLSLTPRRR